MVTQRMACADIDEILPLPQWSGPDIAGSPPPRLGGLLLPDGLLVDDESDTTPRLPSEAPVLTSELQASTTDIDLSLFLPDALLGKTIRTYESPGPTPLTELRDLDDNFLTICRESPADEHLIDPESHVSETQKEDLLRFLEFHARDARIKAYVVVTDRDQTVPKTADLSNIASGSLTSQDSCLAVYPLGEPWRARLFLSAAIHKSVSPDYLTSLVQDCAKDAQLVNDPLEQLHRFTVRLSIRLFWLEKLIAAGQPAPQVATREDIPSDIIVKREAALNEALLERDMAGRRKKVDGWSVVFGILLSLAGGAVTYAALRYRRRRLIGFVWMLPEIETRPRLGGEFSGGGGASIAYR
jgi:hypothetical protein